MTISIRGPLLPAWTRLEPPNPQHPYWHDSEDCARRHLHELLSGADPATAEQLARLHRQAIERLAAAALDAHRTGDDGEARRLSTAAARLCEEIVGLWPLPLAQARER